jgi:hypothetical protein
MLEIEKMTTATAKMTVALATMPAKAVTHATASTPQ